MYNNNNRKTNDTIEWIEEYLHTNKTIEICQLINSMNERLWCFSLRKCTINDANFEKLVQTLKGCKSTLCYLNLNVNIINSIERVNILTPFLSKLSYLHTLSLHSSNLKDEGLKQLHYSLVKNKNFKSLDIGDCGLSDKSVEYIREIIHRRQQDNGLKELIISSNPLITITGWSQLLISIASAADLEYLYMDFNNLDDSCGYLIAAILSANHTLKTIDLEHTNLTNKSALLLLYLFRNYSLSIETLNLINNTIDESLMNEIQHYVDNKTHDISKLKLDQSNIEESILINDSYDFKMRDQVKLDQYVKNGHKLDMNNLSLVSEYEKSLERDFKSLLIEKNRIESRSNHSAVQKSKRNFNEENDELLEPTKEEDQRYRSHNILPFNLSS